MEKGLLQSKTFIGVMLALLGQVLGWSPEFVQEFTGSAFQGAEAILTGVGSLIALYGRAKAQSSIKGLWVGKGGKSQGRAEIGAILAILVASLLMLSVVGCSNGQVIKPERPGEAIAAAYASYTTTLRLATSASRAGLVDKELHDRLSSEFDNIEHYLNEAVTAWAAGKGDKTDEWLRLAKALLQRIAMEVPRHE